MLPLDPSSQVERMLSFLKDSQEDEDGSVSQEKSHHKSGWEDFPQDGKDGRIRGGSQKKNDSCRAAENLQKNKKNKTDLKLRNKDEKNGKDERIEREGKDPHRNPGYEIKTKEEDIKEEKPGKISHRNDRKQNKDHPDDFQLR